MKQTSLGVNHRRHRWLRRYAPILALAFALQSSAQAQTVTATLPTGVAPDAVAVNPVTNKIYIANNRDNTVTVVDGATNSSSTVAVGTAPTSVAVNPTTNKIYIANSGSGSVTVIDGASNTTVNVATALDPSCIAINPITNKIYVGDTGSKTVTVIDGLTNTTSQVPVGNGPVSVAVNPVTNKIYVANETSNTVTVIDGATQSVTVVATGSLPMSIAINPITNKIYVANNGTNNVTVIDGASNSTSTLGAGTYPASVAVNPVTNKIYVANSGSNSVTVIDGASNATDTVITGLYPIFVAVNPTTNNIFVANNGNGSVAVIDGATDALSDLVAGGQPFAVAVNPVTNKVYVVNNSSAGVTVIDDAAFDITTVPLAFAPGAVALNAATNKVYVANANGAGITVVHGTTQNTTTVAAGVDLSSIAINPITNKIYVANFSDGGFGTLIDGATNSTSNFSISLSLPGPIVLNPITNKIYYAASCCQFDLTVTDLATNTGSSLSVGSGSFNFAGPFVLNPVTNKIYVETGDEGVTVVDGATGNTNLITFAIGETSSQVSIAINTVTNRIYLATGVSGLSVIDGATNTVTTMVPNIAPVAVAVNQITNKIYLLDASSNGVTVIDGATGAISFVPAGHFTELAVNQTTNKIYLANSNGAAVIDGATNSFSTLPFGAASTFLVNPVTNQLYAASRCCNSLTVLSQNQAQFVPLTTAITSLAGNQTSNPTPSFTFNASSTTATTPSGVYFQVDTWQNAWTAATGSNPSFTGTLSTLQPGVHTLYAFAVDGQQATSSQSGSPLTGAIQSYTFLVTPAAASSGAASGSSILITSQAPGSLRNNYSGFVGMEFTVGFSPIQVSSLGRMVAPGNSGTHLLKLVQANGADVPGGSVNITAGGSVGQYQYAALANSVSLAANTTYFLLSQETAGGDEWYDIGSVTSTGAIVLAPTYTDASGIYVPVAGLPGKSYGPLNLLYGTSSSTAPSLSVSITSPQTGATLSGSTPVITSTTGSILTLQLQVDGLNQGPVDGLTLDTTLLTNGSHILTVVATDSQGGSATSPGVTVTIYNSPAVSSSGVTAFVTTQTPGALRNNYSGLVGFSFTTGASPVTISSLGRYVAPNNSGSHLLKLVNGNGIDVPGGSVSISAAGATPGLYLYAALPTSVTLTANTTYFLMSQEVYGGDSWYDIGPITVTGVATINAPVYVDGSGNYIPVAGLPGQSYVPLSFLYGTASAPVSTLSVRITSPQANASLTANVAVTVATTGNPISFQLQVDDINNGAPVSTNSITLKSSTLTNGTHTLAVSVSDGVTTAVSPAVTVNVINAPIVASAASPFIIGQTPSTLRNNYTGFVGMAIQVGSAPLSVSALGRLYPTGMSGTHLLKIVQANGTDLPSGTVSLTIGGGTSGTYLSATLPTPVTLQANTTYYIVSGETAGADSWYDLEPVISTSAAQVLGPVYSDAQGNFVLVPGCANYSYGPVNFLYQ